MTTSTGRKDAIHVKVWTTTELEKDRHKKKERGGVWRFGRQMKLRKSARKGTAFDAFDLTDAGGPISKAKKRLIFLATWKMLDEAEREFAASLFVQVWWRRWLYRDRPDEMAKCVGWSASRSRIRGI